MDSCLKSKSQAIQTGTHNPNTVDEELLLEKHHSQTRQWIARNSTQTDGTHTQILLMKELLLEKHSTQTDGTHTQILLMKELLLEKHSTQTDGTHNPNTVDEGTATRETSFPDATMDRANSTQIDGTHTQILLTKELLLEKHSTQTDGTHNPNTVDDSLIQ
ncbi:unnamed protein product [Rhizophagus irregularis]|nr:unnamed protein product [Rhizophagus irregularis]CAB5370533.1 unnamed protein product [Rhizophagus irregularis]